MKRKTMEADHESGPQQIQDHIVKNFTSWEPNLDHQRLPRDVRPIFYHLCLKPDLKLLQFSGELTVKINVSS